VVVKAAVEPISAESSIALLSFVKIHEIDLGINLKAESIFPQIAPSHFNSMLMVFRNSHGEFHWQHALDYYFLFSQFLKSTCRSTKSETQTTQAEEDDLRNEAAGDYQALWIRLNAEVKNDLRNDRFQRRCCVIDRRQRKEMMISWDRRQRKQKKAWWFVRIQHREKRIRHRR
jgi:hypothetical protein